MVELKDFRIFSDLKDKETAKLQESIRTIRYERGETIFPEGAPAFGFYLIFEGMVKLVKRSMRAKSQILKIVGPGEILGETTLFDKGSRPLDIAVYLEYIIHNKNYKDYEELEFRLILEKDMGPWRLDFNPIFEKKTSGSGVEEGLEFNYAVGCYYIPDGDGIMLKKNLIIKPGLEFYGKMGEISDLKAPEQQRHVIFPTVEMLIGPRIKWHLGVGIGLTKATDNLILKSILTIILKH